METIPGLEPGLRGPLLAIRRPKRIAGLPPIPSQVFLHQVARKRTFPGSAKGRERRFGACRLNVGLWRTAEQLACELLTPSGP